MVVRRIRYHIWRTNMGRKRLRNIFLMSVFLVFLYSFRDIFLRKGLDNGQVQRTILDENNDVIAIKGNDVILTNKSTSAAQSIQVIIFASKRTGSSFVGELFNQNEDFFYLFEPLEIFTHSVLEKKLPNYLFDSKSADALDKVLRCDFKSTPPEWNLNLHTNCNFGKAISNTAVCQGLHTTAKFPKTKRQIQKHLTSVCSKHRHIAAKIIRVYDINLLRHLVLDQGLNARILHLVRDPRAVFNSRNTLQMINKDFTRRGGGDEILQYCEDVERNLLIAKTSQDLFRNKYLIVRYEDVAANPMVAMGNMYKFLGLDEDEGVAHWISNKTKSRAISKFTTSKKSEQTLEQWRTQISMKQVLVIQEKCERMMRMLGYQKVIDFKHLRDLENSLLTHIDIQSK